MFKRILFILPLFLGLQTSLLAQDMVRCNQLLEDARDTNTAIPACTITDWPALTYRSVHFDVKHHVSTDIEQSKNHSLVRINCGSYEWKPSAYCITL